MNIITIEDKLSLMDEVFHQLSMYKIFITANRSTSSPFQSTLQLKDIKNENAYKSLKYFLDSTTITEEPEQEENTPTNVNALKLRAKAIYEKIELRAEPVNQKYIRSITPNPRRIIL